MSVTTGTNPLHWYFEYDIAAIKEAIYADTSYNGELLRSKEEGGESLLPDIALTEDDQDFVYLHIHDAIAKLIDVSQRLLVEGQAVKFPTGGSLSARLPAPPPGGGTGGVTTNPDTIYIKLRRIVTGTPSAYNFSQSIPQGIDKHYFEILWRYVAKEWYRSRGMTDLTKTYEAIIMQQMAALSELMHNLYKPIVTIS